MILSTNNTQLIVKLRDEKAIEIIAKAGFDAIDYSFHSIKNNENHPFLKPGYASYARHLKEYAELYGVFFNQAHAIFPTGLVDDETFNKSAFKQILQNFEISSILGIKNIVVHPIHCFGHNVDEWQYNIDFYGSLLPYAKEFGIKIAIENMWRVDPNRGFIVAGTFGYGKELADFLDALDLRYFTVCLDIGHSALAGEMPDDVIRLLGNRRLGCLHVHDVDYQQDNHALPFTRNLDFAAITKALGEIDYTGDFTFEADTFIDSIPDEILPVAVKFMHDIGRQLIKMIQDAKTKQLQF